MNHRTDRSVPVQSELLSHSKSVATFHLQEHAIRHIDKLLSSITENSLRDETVPLAGLNRTCTSRTSLSVFIDREVWRNTVTDPTAMNVVRFQTTVRSTTVDIPVVARSLHMQMLAVTVRPASEAFARIVFDKPHRTDRKVPRINVRHFASVRSSKNSSFDDFRATWTAETRSFVGFASCFDQKTLPRFAHRFPSRANSTTCHPAPYFSATIFSAASRCTYSRRTQRLSAIRSITNTMAIFGRSPLERIFFPSA